MEVSDLDMAVFKIVYGEDFGPAPDNTDSNANELTLSAQVEFDPSNAQIEDPC